MQFLFKEKKNAVSGKIAKIIYLTNSFSVFLRYVEVFFPKAISISHLEAELNKCLRIQECKSKKCRESMEVAHIFPFIFVEFLVREKKIQISLESIPRKIKIRNVNFLLSFIVIFTPDPKHFTSVTVNNNLYFLHDDCSEKVLLLSKDYKVNPQTAFYIKENN